MQSNLTHRYLIIGVILAWAIYALLPTWQYQNMTADEKEELRTSGDLEQIESRIIRQGLDLKGGMYIVLEADIPTLMGNLASMKDERLEAILTSAKEKSTLPDVDFFTVFEQDVKADGIKLSRYYHQYGASLDDIMTALKDEADDAINRVLEILQNRVDQFGVAEPTIQKQGKHRIVVELAGIQDSKRARALLQSTALLEFYLVKNAAVTNEIIAQLDDVLKETTDVDELKELAEAGQTKAEEKPVEEAKEDGGTKTVAELFGETDPMPGKATEDAGADIFAEAPFSSLLAALPGDMGVPEKNVYAIKKLLDKPEVQSKLKNANGQFVFSNDAEAFTGTTVPGKFYRLYYLEKTPELTGGVVDKARADLGTIGSGSAGQPVVSLSMNSVIQIQ